MKVAVKFLCIFTALGLCAGLLYSQDYRATIRGLVTDSTQAAVVGAKVVIRNVKTGIENTQQTNETGQYLFNFVEPGTYTASAEMQGFTKAVQSDFTVQTRGDVTVNFTLNPGAVVESVNVTGVATDLQFNTSTMELTVDRKQLDALPIMQRNPFTLALLDPAVVNRYWDIAHRNPFYMWSSSAIDVGGNTSDKNELLLDGAPLMIGEKGSYAPPMDAVQEFSVQQNSVDAEFGHSAGGVMSISIKSGTNEFHGSAYYFGRNPALNAVTDSVNHTPNMVRNHIWGGTLGNPIKKNKLFTFTSYEGWRSNEPNQSMRTLPTELERAGDFSQSYNITGGLRTIYDPWTTQFNAATGQVNRTPFPGNKIPANQIDPTAARFLKDIWLPNNPGDDITGVNNYKIGYAWPQKYLNFNNRTDWNISDNWKVFGRFSRVRTTLDQTQYVDSPAVKNDNGGIMNNTNIALDSVYTMNPTTVLDFRFSYGSLQDDYNAPKSAIGESGLGQYWPNNPWYQPYVAEMPLIYYPSLYVGGASFGMGIYWYQHPKNYSWEGSLRKTAGIHSLKFGLQGRRTLSDGIYPDLMDFGFPADLTANTFISPDTRLSGYDWASFMIGAVDGSSYATHQAFQRTIINYWAGYFQDDIRATRRVTFNLGLRYEYEGGPTEANGRLSRYLDLTNPIPEMQANPPQMPAAAQQYLTPGLQKFNGAWVYTDSSHPGMFDAQRLTFLPRAGVAIRINDKTALRAGWGRYVVPPVVISGTLGPMNMWGFNAQTYVQNPLEGIPQARLSDPFPAQNPLVLPVGKAEGRYTKLGDSTNWYQVDQHTQVNDRFNVSLQRQLPMSLHLDATYFWNISRNGPYDLALNMSDPNLSYTYKSALAATVPNPFYNYMTPETFPGPLRNQPTVTVGSLLKPYPQYGSLTQNYTNGVDGRYQAIQLKIQRPLTRGVNFLVAYNYNHERNTGFFNTDDQYAGNFTWIPSINPRHRLSAAGTWELPFGKGRKFANNLNPLLNGILGGWSTSHLFMISSGQFLRFGQMITDGSNPAISDRTPQHMFDTSKFQKPDPYTPRTNPLQYPGVTGPKTWSLDSTLAKTFPIRERFNLEFKLEAYNSLNGFVWNNPNMSVTSSLFGRSTDQANRGREVQYSLRLLF